MDYPKEKPPRRDFILWEEAIRQIVPAGGIQDRLGNFNHIGFKKWEWCYDEDNNRLLHYKGERMAIYRKSQQERYVHMANRWTLLRENRISNDCGLVCSIREVSTRTVAIMSTAAAPHPPDLPTCFLDVLVEWGSTWMWENLRLIRN